MIHNLIELWISTTGPSFSGETNRNPTFSHRTPTLSWWNPDFGSLNPSFCVFPSNFHRLPYIFLASLGMLGPGGGGIVSSARPGYFFGEKGKYVNIYVNISSPYFNLFIHVSNCLYMEWNVEELSPFQSIDWDFVLYLWWEFYCCFFSDMFVKSRYDHDLGMDPNL